MRSCVRFYLGTHRPNWLGLTDVPLFVSRRTLTGRKTLPRARGPWALDSGGFTELSMYGNWRTSEDEYVRDVGRFHFEVGQLEWVAPMDWMCEDFVLRKTGLTVRDHQLLTVRNFQRLRARLGPIVVPVLQGQTVDDYLRCVELYERGGYDLPRERLVAVGTVCRRSQNLEAVAILRPLAALGLRLHAFGIKGESLRLLGDDLASADSLAWSFAARRSAPSRGCSHKSCANCLRYALRWRERLLTSLGQMRLEAA